MAIAMVATTGRGDQVTLPKAGLLDDVRRYPGITGVGEITVCGPADEATITRWIEPSRRFTVRYDRCRRCLRLHTTTASPPTVTTMAPAVSIVAIVAIVPVVAV